MYFLAYLGVAGLTDVGYQFFNANATANGARITTGIADEGGGYYSADATVPGTGTPASIRWDSTGTPAAAAREPLFTLQSVGTGPGQLDITSGIVKASSTEITAIKAKTDQLTFTVANQVDANTLSLADNVITAAKLAADALSAAKVAADVGTELCDALLKRDLSVVTGESSRSVLNAIRFLRNKWTITTGTLSVKKEDDTTEAWNAVLTTDAAAIPITGSDPT